MNEQETLSDKIFSDFDGLIVLGVDDVKDFIKKLKEWIDENSYQQDYWGQGDDFKETIDNLAGKELIE